MIQKTVVSKIDLDYVELYARKLKEDNTIFKLQKLLIESQMHASADIFKNWFGADQEFRLNARKYLKQIGIL